MSEILIRSASPDDAKPLTDLSPEEKAFLTQSAANYVGYAAEYLRTRT